MLTSSRMLPDEWPLTPESLLEALKTQGIQYDLHRHPAFFTVGEGLEFEKNIPGAHCRNLFLRDKGKTVFLLVAARNETKIDLKKLGAALGVGRLSFGAPELLWEHLGVKPGSVCPYAILNDRGRRVRLILEEGMLAEEIVNFHPLLNTMTVGLRPGDMAAFLDKAGRAPEFLDMAALAPDITG